jgi:hypothetical protein
VDVNRHDGLGAIRDFGLDLLDIQVKGLGVYVNKDWNSILMENWMKGTRKGKSTCDYFAAWANTGRK